jgi:hypothetical protein
MTKLSTLILALMVAVVSSKYDGAWGAETDSSGGRVCTCKTIAKRCSSPGCKATTEEEHEIYNHIARWVTVHEKTCPLATTSKGSLDADKPTIPKLPESPAKLIETLKASGERYTVHTARLDFVKGSDIPHLVSLLDSKEPCAFVDLAASSIYSPGKSTVGHEAAYMVEGFYKRYYPTELTSQLHKPNITAIKQWYQMWSHLKNVAEQVGAGQPATRPESKSEGGDKPQPEAERRSR